MPEGSIFVRFRINEFHLQSVQSNSFFFHFRSTNHFTLHLGFSKWNFSLLFFLVICFFSFFLFNVVQVQIVFAFLQIEFTLCTQGSHSEEIFSKIKYFGLEVLQTMNVQSKLSRNMYVKLPTLLLSMLNNFIPIFYVNVCSSVKNIQTIKNFHLGIINLSIKILFSLQRLEGENKFVEEQPDLQNVEFNLERENVRQRAIRLISCAEPVSFVSRSVCSSVCSALARDSNNHRRRKFDKLADRRQIFEINRWNSR